MHGYSWKAFVRERPAWESADSHGGIYEKNCMGLK